MSTKLRAESCVNLNSLEDEVFSGASALTDAIVLVPNEDSTRVLKRLHNRIIAVLPTVPREREAKRLRSLDQEVLARLLACGRGRRGTWLPVSTANANELGTS
jgi:hypothetical protein